MNDFYDVLENCLEALEGGADLESVLARYPEQADELRPILDASVAARNMAVPGPSAEAMRRGRAKVLQRAAQLREERAPASRRVIPVFQRLSLALTIAAVFLLSGTGLARASATALPGERLYPVKRTLEDVRLFFVFDDVQRKALEGAYENERLHEIDELLAEGRHESIQFAGVVMDVNGVVYVSGIRVVIVDTSQLPPEGLQNGLTVIVTGRTNAEGFVEIESIATLPPGSIVPVGNPIEIETSEEHASESGSEGGTGQTPSGGDAGGASGVQPNSDLKYFKIEGTVDTVSNGVAVINGQTVYIDQAQISGIVVTGVRVEAEGYFASDGRFIVTEIKVEHEEPESDESDDSSGSGSTNDENNNDDSNDSENHDEENSGSGSSGSTNENDSEGDDNDNDNENENGND
ncbi:MAG: DUF5667 domain-containing protein [Chloroflexota bacterium]